MITHKNAIAMLSGLVYLVEKVRYIAESIVITLTL